MIKLVTLNSVVLHKIAVGEGQVIAHIDEAKSCKRGLEGLELSKGICNILEGITLESPLIIIEYHHFFQTNILTDWISHIEGIKTDLIHVIVKLTLFPI